MKFSFQCKRSTTVAGAFCFRLVDPGGRFKEFLIFEGAVRLPKVGHHQLSDYVAQVLGVPEGQRHEWSAFFQASAALIEQGVQ